MAPVPKDAHDATVTFALPHERVPEMHAPGRRASPRPEGWPVPDEANRVVLDKYGPPGVVVDANLDIVHFRGHTGLIWSRPPANRASTS